MAHGMVPHSWCHECNAAYSLARYYQNREAYTARASAWQVANRDKARAAAKKWKDANPEALIAYNKAKYAANADAQRAQTAAWKKANPDKANLHNRNRRAMREKADGSHTLEDIAAIRVLQKGRCAYCRELLKSAFHVDHIVPLVKGGSNNRSNLQLTCERCNLEKGSRDPLHHARLIGRLI